MDRSPQFVLDTDVWEDGGANVQIVHEGDQVGVYVEAGAIADGTRGAVATPEQAEALGRELIARAADAVQLREAGLNNSGAAPTLERGDHVAPNNPYGVEPGQVWADNDKRMAGRKVRVVKLNETHAICEETSRGKRVRIRLDRFKPTSTGWRRVP